MSWIRGEHHPGWRRLVRDRAKDQCEICTALTSNSADLVLEGNGMTELHIHHIRPKKSFPRLKKNLENLILLCQECHAMMEGKFGTRLEIINWGRGKILRSILEELKAA